MEQRTVVITGANSGLGFQCAKNIASADPNYTVVLACRDARRAADARDDLRRDTGNPNIVPLMIDLSSLESVRAFCDNYDAASLPPLHSLVCNAGFNTIGKMDYTTDGYESVFQVCYLGHFLLANLMLSRLTDQGRLVFVSSDMHYTTLSKARAVFTDAYALAHPTAEKRTMFHYSMAKLCLIMCTLHMARRLGPETGMTATVNAINPGLMTDTKIWQYPHNPVGRTLERATLSAISRAWGQGSTSVASGRVLADMVTDSRYAGINGEYISFLGVQQSSSFASRDKAAARTLWRQSVDLAHLTPADTPLRLDPDEDMATRG
ncbi:MAG: SDR family NAD(P)-dependent oxidoreductase [Propionibacteriaceae bacterium]|nr:SDR family NAD(P)-dependent oxidoreductase [Propionibacteriaceae bacterium]